MMLKWILTTASHYNGLELKDPNALYFIEDTHEIYRGSTEFTSSLYFVDELPEFAAKGKIYVKSSNLEGSVWTGEEWKVVLPQIHNVLEDDIECEGLVTGNAIKNYVASKIAEMGGSIELNTDSIVTTKQIKVLGQTLGSYKDGDIIPAGETLTSILSKQFAKQIPPTYQKPTYSISPGSGAKEAGDIISFNVTGSFTKKDGGDLTSYTLSKYYNGETTNVVDGASSIENYREESITVEDGANLRYTGTVNYADGPIKNDNLDMPYPNGSIKAGQLSASFTYTGQRKTFYGRDNQTEAANDSAAVRALPQNVLNAGNGTKLTISILAGDKRVTFAYPATLRDVTSVISSALNLDVKGTFVKESVQVEGLNGYKPIEYKVYTYIPAIPFASGDTYTVTI